MLEGKAGMRTSCEAGMCAHIRHVSMLAFHESLAGHGCSSKVSSLEAGMCAQARLAGMGTHAGHRCSCKPGTVAYMRQAWVLMQARHRCGCSCKPGTVAYVRQAWVLTQGRHACSHEAGVGAHAGHGCIRKAWVLTWGRRAC
eukprot:797854-Pelagomonas_calceolata.AAC.5